MQPKVDTAPGYEHGSGQSQRGPIPTSCRQRDGRWKAWRRCVRQPLFAKPDDKGPIDWKEILTQPCQQLRGGHGGKHLKHTQSHLAIGGQEYAACAAGQQQR